MVILITGYNYPDNFWIIFKWFPGILSNGYLRLNILLIEFRVGLLTRQIKIALYKNNVTIYNNYPD